MENRILGLQSQIKLIRESLNTLELRQAKYGLDIPISLLNEIKQLRTELQEKEQELQYLLQIQPEIQKLYSELMMTLKDEIFEKAVEICDQITELYPGYSDVLEKRILAQRKLDEKKQQERAEQELDAAIENIEQLIKLEAFSEARMELISLLKNYPDNNSLVSLAQEIDLNSQAQQYFVGRGNLLTKMKERVPAYLKGQGAVMLVTGEPGAGKTYLVSEFVRQVQSEYTNVVATFGTCSPYGDTSEAYEPFSEALSFLIGAMRLAWDEEYMSSLENYIRVFRHSQLIRNIIVEHGPVLIDTLISAYELEQEFQSNQSGTEQISLFHQFTNVIEQLTKHTPLILVLDDFQWANFSSIDLFSYLAKKTKTLPLLLILTYRNTDLAVVKADRQHPFLHILSELKRRYGDIEIPVSSSDVDAASFVKEYLDTVYKPHRFYDQFVYTIAKRTGDNALFISELLQYLNNIGSIYQDEKGIWVCPKLIDPDSLPVKIEAVIEERVNQLEDDLKEILVTASVEGEEFTAQTLSSVQKIEERRILKYLTQSLSYRYRLVEEQGARILGKQRLYFFRFRHILFQQYIYNSLTDIEKEILHHDVGLCLEELCSSNLEEVSHLLVRHFYEAHLWDKVITYSLMAAERMVKSFAYVEATSFYNITLEAVSFLSTQATGSDKTTLLEAKAKALQGRGSIFLQWEHLEDAVQDFEKALELKVLPRHELLKRIGRAKEHMGYWKEALDYYRECLEIYQTSEDEIGIIEIYVRLGTILKQMGNWDKSLGFLFQAIERARRLENKYWEARVACNIGMVYYRKQDFEASLSYYQKDLEISKELNDLVGLERSLANVGEVYLEIGKTEKAIEMTKESEKVRAKLGADPCPVANRTIGNAYLRLHNFGQAEKYYQISLNSALNENQLQEISWTLYALGNLHLQMGELSQARNYLNESIEYAKKNNDRWRLSHALFALAQVTEKEQNFQEAINTFEKAHKLATDVGDTNLVKQVLQRLNTLQQN